MHVKIKKIISNVAFFVILLTFPLFTACKTSYKITQIESSKIVVIDSTLYDTSIENFINPYRKHIERDLDSVLAYCPETLDKTKGKWESNIGKFMAKVVYDLSNPIFMNRENKSIDFVVLNQGGIRSTIPMGNVTSRTAFSVMPFENSIIVVALSGTQVKEFIRFFIGEQKPHPIFGLSFEIDDTLKTFDKINIKGIPLEETKLYYIATSDYLSNGGDNMSFFKKSTLKYDLDYKIRALLIDYFKKVSILEIPTTIQITEKK